jgi:D-sedoheptulose 7-phosphate isomerase
MEARLKEISGYLNASIAVQGRVADSCATQILAASDAMVLAFNSGNKVLLCGNGGSAADCQHIAAELLLRLTRAVERPALAAVALTTDTSFLTAHGNDYGFDGVFERQVEALGRPGDVLVAISTSGRSENVRRAVRAAKKQGMVTIGLMGADGPLAGDVLFAVVIPDRDTQHIQEALLPVEHLICLLVERAMFGDPTTRADG